MEVQEKILRVVEYASFERVGSSESIEVDARIIAATNSNLAELAAQGRFKQDLLDRLSFEVLFLPPLRDRKEDIPLLVDHFLEHYGYDKKQQVLPGDILEKLYTYHWPGNIRELQNVLHRYLTIGCLDFRSINNPETEENSNGADREPTQESMRLREAVEDFEKRFIISMLEKHRWHKSKTATALGIPRRTLHRKLKKLRIK